MSIDLLFVWGAIALAFLIGVRTGRCFANAGHYQARLCEAFRRDQDVLDEADMSETSNA